MWETGTAYPPTGRKGRIKTEKVVRLYNKAFFSDNIVKQSARNNMLYGIHYGIQFSLVDVITADSQGDCTTGNGVYNGAQAALLAVHYQIGMGFRDDGYAAVVVNHLYKYSYSSAFE